MDEVKLKYLGCLGFICEHAVYLNNVEDCNETIIQILEDAKTVFPNLVWRQILNRFEIDFLGEETVNG